MTWLDTVIVVVIALSTLLSLLRGAVKEVLSLVAWVLAFWLAFRYAAAAASLFEVAIPYEGARLGTAFLLIFIAVLLAGSLLGSLVSRLVRAGGLGAADRALGAVFGAARGGIAAVVLVTLAALTPLAQGAAWQGSRLVTYCTVLSGLAMDGWGGASGAVAGTGAAGAGKFVDGG